MVSPCTPECGCAECRKREWALQDTETGQKRYSMAEIVNRMNWIGSQPFAVRHALREDCAHLGHHLPTGERVMVNPPLQSCYHCGDEYR